VTKELIVAKELTTIRNAEALVAAYETIDRDMRLVQETGMRCLRLIRSVTGNPYANVTKQSRFEYEELYQPEHLLKMFWRTVVAQSGIKNIMSVRTQQELERQLNNPESLPPFTVQNIHSFLDGLLEKAKDFVDEAIEEIYEFLTPQRTGYKTNVPEEIGKRVILPDVLSSYGPNYYVLNDYFRPLMNSLDRLFHILDGERTPKIMLFERLHHAVRQKQQCYQDEYFKIKWYRKTGTIHIEFMRPDIVQKINALAGGDRLKKAA
jgi:hypothetical protein